MRRAALLLLFLSITFPVYSQNGSYDILITGGRIVDGTGNPWFEGNVAINGNRILAIGRTPPGNPRQTIDAAGKVVAPGFIDIHTHSRGGIFQVPDAGNYIRQGVTTVMEGNDGGSPLPLPAFFEKLRKTPVAVNLGLFVGQGSVRQKVIGLENRKATPAEIREMEDLVRTAMLDGAFGISTGLFYVPGNYTPTEEVIALARVAGEMGGMYISHMRDEAAGVLDSVRETIRIGKEGGLPTQVTHHKIIGKQNWGRSDETLRLVEEARAGGVDVTIDQYPYTASSTGTAALFPQWSLEGGRKALLERLGTPDQRARIKAEIIARIRDDRGGGDPKNVVMASCGFDPSLAGQNLGQITRAKTGESTLEAAAETAITIQESGGCSAIYHAISEADVEQIMRSPYSMVASDGGIPVFGKEVPHPRSYGTFARVLGRYSRDRQVIPLEEAVRKMSSFPAARLKIMDRGLLRPGMLADVVVFDAAAVRDRAEFLHPHQYAEGFSHVIVNGKPVLLDGKMTGELPGRILYGPAWRSHGSDGGQ
ncbi:MAG: D-aminoacylase [Bryobacteraceae bacterium]|nr:D-aminoacylase [Bryobacteraceae bacterium]